ncbi:hypothetical protein ACF0H5_005548 [Mactra antiquata]
MLDGIIGDYGPVLDMRCDMQPVFNGQGMTLQDICGNLSIVVHGISTDRDLFPLTSFPWNLELSLITDTTEPPTIVSSTKSATINEADLYGNDNITSLVLNQLAADPLFEVPMGSNDNRGGMGTVSLTSSNSSVEKRYFESSKFTVLTDFRNVNLMLEKIGDLQTPFEPMVDGTSTWSSIFQSSLLVDSNKVYLSGDLPQLEPVDTCVFAVAYLVPNDDNGDSWITPDYDCMDEHMVPRFTTRDTLVGLPVCYKSDSVSPIDLLDIIRNADDPENPVRVCGRHTLVLQVDALDTLGSEADKCDNYVTLDVDFKCDPSMFEIDSTDPATMSPGRPLSKCGLYLNPFGVGRNDLFEPRFKYTATHFNGDPTVPQQYSKYTKLVQNDGYGWRHSDHSRLEEEGFAAVEIFTKYMKSTYQTSFCDSLGDLKQAVNELEGLNEPYEESNMASLDPLYSAFAAKVDAMRTDPTTGIQQHINDASAEMQNLNAIPMTISNRVAKAAVNTTMDIAMAIQNNNLDYFKQMASHDACSMAHELESLTHSIVHMVHDPINSQMWMEGIAGNLTRVVMTLKYLYPEFTCLEKNLKLLVRNVEQFSTEDLNVDWMYNSRQVQEVHQSGKTMFDRDYCHATVNNCIKKLKTKCHDITSDQLPVDIEASRDEVCLAKYIKEKAKQQFKSLGLHRIRTLIEDDNSCSSDPVEPFEGALVLYKTAFEMLGSRETEFVYKGTMTLDNTGLYWRKMAVCTCDSCMSP